MPIQNTLFDTDGLIDKEKALQQVAKQNKTKKQLTPLEKEISKFEKLLKDIALIEKEAIVNNEEQENEQQNFNKTCIPQLIKLAETKYKFLLLIEKIYDQNTFKKNEQVDVCNFIISYAEDGIDYYEPLKEIYKKYYHISISLLSNKQKKKLAAQIDDFTDGKIKVDANDFNGNSFFDNTFEEFNEWQHTESKKQVSHKKEDIDNAKFVSTKELYKDLAKALHPDLEQNENIKTIKVSLMQELSIAKQNNDLYAMLQVQNKAAQYISNEQKQKYYTIDKLKEFNKLLKQKYNNLKVSLQQQILNSYTVNNNGYIQKKDSIKATLKKISNAINATNNTMKTIKDKYDLLDLIDFESIYYDDDY